MRHKSSSSYILTIWIHKLLQLTRGMMSDLNWFCLSLILCENRANSLATLKIDATSWIRFSNKNAERWIQMRKTTLLLTPFKVFELTACMFSDVFPSRIQLQNFFFPMLDEWIFIAEKIRFVNIFILVLVALRPLQYAFPAGVKGGVFILSHTS